jgi:Fe-S cluster assembly protein SufB
MLEKRLQAFHLFQTMPLPTWGPSLSELHFHEMIYFLRAQDKPERSWDDVPSDIRTTFERIGIPEAEGKYLAGVGAQYESESIYHNLKKEWEEVGVIFCDTDTAVREHPDLVKQYFGTIIPAKDHTFAALNTAVWSGGSFLYVPAGVKLTTPLQAYFRMNARNAGQFERTLIIVEEGAQVHYVEGCSAPIYSTDSLHAAVVEVFVKADARARYTTVQNWSNNVYNLVTKRATVQRRGVMEWVDCNLGSKVTMKYPSSFLIGEGARADTLSLALAGPDQIQDAGAKIIHLAPNTSGSITSKSVAHGGGVTTYRGQIKVGKKATGARTRVTCDTLLLDESSRGDTYPTIDIQQPQARAEHEASVSRLSETQLFYLQARGLTASEASGAIINGFLEPIVKELPMEYAMEMNRLIELQMEGSVG